LRCDSYKNWLEWHVCFGNVYNQRIFPISYEAARTMVKKGGDRVGISKISHLCLSATGLLGIRFHAGNSFGKETVDTAFVWRIAKDGMEKGQGSEITGAR